MIAIVTLCSRGMLANQKTTTPAAWASFAELFDSAAEHDGMLAVRGRAHIVSSKRSAAPHPSS